MTDPVKINRPGAPTNPPQHLLDEGSGISEGRPSGETVKARAHRQTGANTSPDPANEVQDPHPSDEERPYDANHPGGAYPPTGDLGPNDAVHTGKAPPRPRNAENDAE